MRANASEVFVSTAATVASVESKTSDAFARILLQPTAGVSRHRQLLVLMSDASALPPPPPPENNEPDPRNRRMKKESQE